MKVVAIKNDYSGLVKKEREYIVLGTYTPKKYLGWKYLISSDGDSPNWESSEYFNIIDNDILPNWHMKIYDQNDHSCDLFCLLGFDELCNNEDYFDALVEREKWILEIYTKRYKEAVEWYEVKPFMTKKTSLW